ncbi:MAG: hypothetical protein ABIR68_18285, partial [Ilumatobacteraceae bacterium]
DAPAFSVQYHPEAGPGPHDSRYLFAMFAALMDGGGTRQVTIGTGMTGFRAPGIRQPVLGLA